MLKNMPLIVRCVPDLNDSKRMKSVMGGYPPPVEGLDMEMTYEKNDYLLIRNDEVIAVSGNADFDDGEHPITGLKTDTVAQVVSNGDEIVYINVDFKG